VNPKDRLIVALDRSSRDEILRLVEELQGEVGLFKIGLQAFVANGPSIVRDVMSAGGKILLDLKFHDIPNTAAQAVREAAELGVRMLTLHASGGEPMLRASAQAPGSGHVILLGVTLLTSLEEDDLRQLGLEGGIESGVLRLAELAKRSGLGGVVASPREIERLRQRFGGDLVIVTPGIRGAGDAADDQKRTMTAGEAVRAGADYLVVGRPITEAASPVEAARRIVGEMDGGANG